MFIFSTDRKHFVNCNNIAYLKVREPWDGGSGEKWEILAVFSGGSYVVLNTYYCEEDCRRSFNKLCETISENIDNNTIYMDCSK